MRRTNSWKSGLLALALLTTSCGVIGSDRFDGRTSLCPPLKEYSAEEQDQALRELKLIPDDWVTQAMIDDYRVLRDQIRACR